MANIVSKAESANAQNVMPTSTIILKTMPTYTPATLVSFSSALSSFFLKFPCSITAVNLVLYDVHTLCKLSSKLKRELLSHKAPLPIRGCSSSRPYEVGSFGMEYYTSSALSVAPSPAPCAIHYATEHLPAFRPSGGLPSHLASRPATPLRTPCGGMVTTATSRGSTATPERSSNTDS